jgi:phosphoglycolate phosphatase-like HAD superfamily hydrolase
VTKPRRLLIFDIDGTLIASGGAGSDAMRAAFAALWGASDGFKNVEFSGRSDKAIFRNAFQLCGLGDSLTPEEFRRAKRAYLRRLDQSLIDHKGTILPGVIPLLERLSCDDGVTLTLGTGNFRNGALRKLRYYGLDRYFRSPADAAFRHGGFGDRVEERPLLVAEAVRSAQRMAGKHDRIMVIGDTIHDITAAKANNVIAVGVATGTTSEVDLAHAGADVVLPNLESVEDVF